MPIREACHVALQKISPSKQRLWKHALARHNDKGQGPMPVLQIVCLSILLLFSIFNVVFEVMLMYFSNLT